MKNLFFLIALLLSASSALFAQVGINNDNSQPNSSAMLDVKSNTRGFLPPRMTHAEITNIQNPANGLIIYCTDCGVSGTGAFMGYIYGAWNIFLTCLPSGSPAAGVNVPSTTQIVWNWSAASGATGYKLHTIANYATATDIGNTTTWIETGLSCNTPYTRYIWAYNACGNSIPVTLTQTTSFCNGQSCPGTPTITDPRDGKVYNTVLIGTQCWMQGNLNVGTRISGSLNQANNQIIEKYCYNDLESNCDTRGGLYQWAEMVQYLNGATYNTSWNPVPVGNVIGICPPGWHIPTDAEWTTLSDYLGGENIAGGKMKETGTLYWSNPNAGASNSSGFTGRPGGWCGNSPIFSQLNDMGYLWSSSEYSATYVWARQLYYNDAVNLRFDNLKWVGFSVRCLKD